MSYGAGMDLMRLSDEVEVVSSGYAARHHIQRDATWFLLKLQEEVGELTQAFLMRSGQSRAKGHTPQQLDELFANELADVVCHALLLARHHDVNIQDAITRKWLVWNNHVTTTGTTHSPE